MSFDITETGIFGDAPADDTPNDQNLDNDAESDAGALDVDPATLTSEPAANTDEADPAPKSKHVPLSALQEERQRRQEHAADLARERENYRILQERFNQYLVAQQQQAQQPQQQAEPIQIPSFQEDPEGHVRALTQQFEQKIAQLTQGNQQQQQYTQEAQLRQMLVQEGIASETKFRAATPDYDAAIKHLIDRETAKYSALGLDAVAASARVSNDFFGLIAHAKQTNQDPATLAYNLAKAAGYTANTKPPAQQQQQQLAPQNPANTSLSSLPGANAAEDDGKMTAAKINAMSDAEFAKFCKDMARAAGSNQRPRT